MAAAVGGVDWRLACYTLTLMLRTDLPVASTAALRTTLLVGAYKFVLIAPLIQTRFLALVAFLDVGETIR